MVIDLFNVSRTSRVVFDLDFTGSCNLEEIVEPPGSFSIRGAHPEERSDEGSHEILPRFARQDEGSNIRKNTPTPQLLHAFLPIPCLPSQNIFLHPIGIFSALRVR